VEAGFRQWLAVDAAHRRAFEQATEAWELAASVSVAGTPRMTRWPEKRDRPLVWGIAAVAVGIAPAGISTLYWIHDPTLSTGVGEQRMVTLEDGSRITLNTSTRLSVQYEPRVRYVRLLEGEALFDVAKMPDRPFIVTAGDRDIRALGTSFDVRREENRVVVMLLEGNVTVLSNQPSGMRLPGSPNAPAAPVETLTPGDRVTFAGATPTRDRPPVEDVTAWRNGEVVLDKTRLVDAVTEMNRYSTTKVMIDRPEAANVRVSGIFRAGDSVRFAHAVAETYHLEVVPRSHQILLTGAPATNSPSGGGPEPFR